ncbi:FdtA/QdtA family cupin domain-containing protein [Polynucleobacter sp. 78F-HAINBA]|uniref:sugar 3,4-ketoisomerase n=1 Tax=Polynucleobacter sp. 78F-HAINBA TaxID=2689099 RepID=UPI001C0D30AA|nr:FdtA/QdtA family cupin domain-containing protein [Polynucleobacter sp. 78F-HAINBA]MBU3590679.1 FdtA/QdtA family cupin domain-containing protein [Polynucleobacter sp. 78F-HAINBA]
MTSHFITLQLPTFTDLRGSLTVLENALPFDVVRMYWIHEADGQIRGGHRHTYTRQALIAMRGRISIYMNDGVSEEVIELSQPNKCLLVEPKDWHTMTFGPDSILMVLSSHTYDRSEYIDLPYGG